MKSLIRKQRIRYKNDPACGVYYLITNKHSIKVVNEQYEYIWSKCFLEEIKDLEITLGNFSTVAELIKVTLIDNSKLVYSTQGSLLYDSKYKEDKPFANYFEENKAPVLKSYDVSPGLYKIEIELTDPDMVYQLFDTRGNCVFEGDSHKPTCKVLVLENEVLQIKSYDPIKIVSMRLHTIEYEPKICVIGDSTLANQMLPYWSWPQMLQAKSDFVVVNFAISGRSTKGFDDEGRFKRVWDSLTAGDKLIVGFGHNDQKQNYFGTSLEEYKKNIDNIVKCCLERKIEPVLVTPIARRVFVNEELEETLEPYLSCLRSNYDRFIIDTNGFTKNLILELGIEESKKLYVHNEQIKTFDNTHTSLYGASQICENFIIELNKKSSQ